MRYLIVLIACSLLFAGCSTKIDVHPSGGYDTLGIHWMTIERNNAIYYFQGTGEKGASVYTDMYEHSYDTLASVFKPKLPRKLRFFVWTDWVQARQILNYPLSFAQGSKCECHSRVNQQLGHEMTHIITYWADGVPWSSYSRLVTEGVAVAFDLTHDDRIAKAKSALKGQNIHSVADLWSGSYQEAEEKVFYPIAGAFMDFMFKKGLREKFDALIKNQTQAEAEIIYGKEQLDALIKEFDGTVGLH